MTAGLPCINTLSGNSPFTTLPAAITQLFPIDVPFNIVTFNPTQTLFPISIDFGLSRPIVLSFEINSCPFESIILTPDAITQLLPIFISFCYI